MPSRSPVHRPPSWKPRVEVERDRKRTFNTTRPSSWRRGYDRDWRKLRAAYLNAHPFCCMPLCGALAAEVDHIRSVADYPELRLEWANLRALCKSHHSRHTALSTGFAR